MTAVAVVAACLATIRTGIDRPSHPYQCHLGVGPLHIIDGDGRETRSTSDGKSERSGRWNSPAVLDATLKDIHLSTLPRFYNSDDPRAELGRMLSVRRDDRTGVVWITLSGETPAEAFFGAAALEGAIRAKGPSGVIITRPAGPVRMPLPPGPLDRRWKIVAAVTVAVVLTFAILFVRLPTTARSLVPVLFSRASRRRRDD